MNDFVRFQLSAACQYTIDVSAACSGKINLQPVVGLSSYLIVGFCIVGLTSFDNFEQMLKSFC